MTPYQASKLLFFMWGENMGFIYKITNDVNGKVYIGKTLNTVESQNIATIKTVGIWKIVLFIEQ